MATYNGAAFVEEQIESILSELGPLDEVIIVDDGSDDDTVRRIEAIHDERIRVIKFAINVGHVRAFECALAQARGALVFLSDQDDVWPAGRIELLRRALQSTAVVVGNVATLDGPEYIRGPLGEKIWRLRAGGEKRRIRTLGRLALADVPYYGSAMGFRRAILDLALPFPNCACESHDWWIAIVGLTTRSLTHLEDTVVRHRFHENNFGNRGIRSPWLVLRARLYFIQMVWTAWRRAQKSGWMSHRGLPQRRSTV